MFGSDMFLSIHVLVVFVYIYSGDLAVRILENGQGPVRIFVARRVNGQILPSGQN